MFKRSGSLFLRDSNVICSKLSIAVFSRSNNGVIVFEIRHQLRTKFRGRIDTLSEYSKERLLSGATYV